MRDSRKGNERATGAKAGQPKIVGHNSSRPKRADLRSIKSGARSA